jgi:hypothetical protein
MQIAPVTQAPNKHKEANGLKTLRLARGKREVKRISPYLPSFRRMAARTIEPASGASTWAFGSQRCKEKIGILTKKAIIVITHHTEIIRPLTGGSHSKKFINIEPLV